MTSALTIIENILIYGIPILFAITLHEIAHGWVASKLGDKTALMLGRLTLNPIKHIDLVGTIMVPTVLMVLGGFIFGWAKPVPIDWRNLRHPRRDTALVAAAGPLSNFLMALFWLGMMKLAMLLYFSSPLGPVLLKTGQIGVMVNLILFVLNFIPIPPLDGSRVVASLLPKKTAYYYNLLEPFGFMILIFLLALGFLTSWFSPIVFAIRHFLLNILHF